MKTVFNDEVQYSKNFTQMLQQAEDAEQSTSRKQQHWSKQPVDDDKVQYLNPHGHLVQLFNIEQDPNERKEISTDHPYVVNLLLFRLANYYVSFKGLLQYSTTV